MNPGENLGIWLGLLVAFLALAAWNISRLAIVRPAIDRLVAFLGAGAILAVVVGASLVVTEVTECGFAASSDQCSPGDILLVFGMDLAASAALVTAWLRTDACRAPYAGVRPIPKTRRQRAVVGEIVRTFRTGLSRSSNS